jgi:hypothetical protein
MMIRVTVMLSHRKPLVANLCQLQPVVEIAGEEVGIAVLPFFHIYGVNSARFLGRMSCQVDHAAAAA